MGSSSCVLSIVVLAAVLSFHFGVTSSSSFPPSCHDEESSALLQFKQTVVVVGNDSKLLSWKPPGQGENKTCCSWYGVKCDKKTGHVIALDLMNSSLYGSINLNSTLFRLVHLEMLDLSFNDFNFSQIPPTIRNLSNLRYLRLSYSYFTGQVPAEISQLSKLIEIDLSGNVHMFSRERFLSSLAQNLTSLELLGLSGMNITSTMPDTTIANLSHLKVLDLTDCGLFGKLQFSLGNLGNLSYLYLASNQLSGIIPSSIGNLDRLTELLLSGNKFSGSIPHSLFKLMNLQSCDLSDNNLSGTVELSKFLRIQSLTILFLSGNMLEVLTESRSEYNATTSVPKFEVLGLGWCNLKEFPSFLRSQVKLDFLDLSGNKLQGKVPKWMWNTIAHNPPIFLNLSQNFLSGFEQSIATIPWVFLNINVLDLSFNMFSELLLLPSASSAPIEYLVMANNKLRGQVSPMLCNLTCLQYLDSSNNQLTGNLLNCGRNFGVELKYLNARNNSFHGIFSQSSDTNISNLLMLDISHNNFQGQLPRSLANCASVEILVLSHNKFNDTFPFPRLGVFPELKILAIDHNVFCGVIEKPKKNLNFPVLQILDLSYNKFSGEFPFEYIFSGNETRITSHLENDLPADLNIDIRILLPSSITIMSKGVERYYSKIREDLTFIDISSNNFEGKIPEFIGKLEGLWSLNISNNMLTGSIPSSLSNLSRLESLDLSHNKLSGQLPQQLAQLDFLSKFNVSYNNLTGPVPRGIHFTTFDSSSYIGNQGLCGDLLPKKCGDSGGTQLPPSTSEDNDSESGFELDWKFAAAGCGSGLLVGVVLADFVISKWSLQFTEVVAVLIRLTKRMRRIRN